MARIKGAAFREFVVWVGESRGASVLARAVAHLPNSEQARFDLDRPGLGILPATWYPAPLIHRLLDALLEEAPGQRIALARGGARATIDATLRGVYRILFAALATPERYARHSQRLWDGYYDNGRLEIHSAEPGVALSRISGWSSHHPLICEMHEHAAARLYEAMGCRDVRTRRLTCIASGAAACEFETRWKV
jgi:hypothetical protein